MSAKTSSFPRSQTALQKIYVAQAVQAWLAAGGSTDADVLKGRGHAPRGRCPFPSTVRDAGGPVLELRDMSGRPAYWTHATLAAVVEAAIKRGYEEWNAPTAHQRLAARASAAVAA